MFGNGVGVFALNNNNNHNTKCTVNKLQFFAIYSY